MFRGRMANPCSSKYTHSKYVEHCQKLHKKKLAQMKPAIDNKTPKKPSHFKNNRKREQMMEDRFARIERENRILLEKMSYIMQKKTLDNDNDARRYTRSLNKPFRKKELERITQENKNILRRIQKREPFYNHMQWEVERKRHEEYLRNICEYKPGAVSVRKKNCKKTSDRGKGVRQDNYHSGMIPRLNSNNHIHADRDTDRNKDREMESSYELNHSQSEAAMRRQFRTDSFT